MTPEMPTNAEQIARLRSLAKFVGRNDARVLTGTEHGYLDVATLQFKAFSEYEFTAASAGTDTFDMWRRSDQLRNGSYLSLDGTYLTESDVVEIIRVLTEGR